MTIPDGPFAGESRGRTVHSIGDVINWRAFRSSITHITVNTFLSDAISSFPSHPNVFDYPVANSVILVHVWRSVPVAYGNIYLVSYHRVRRVHSPLDLIV